MKSKSDFLSYFEHFLWFGRISSPLFDWDPRRWQDDLALVHTVVPGSGKTVVLEAASLEFRVLFKGCVLTATPEYWGFTSAHIFARIKCVHCVQWPGRTWGVTCADFLVHSITLSCM